MPAQVLREQLASARRRGGAFESAWPAALGAALAAVSTPWDRREWSIVFGETVEAWRSAWERRPASRCERALQAVADDPERVPVSETVERVCEHCGVEIPHSAKRSARFCCDRHRKNAHYARSHSVAA